MRNIRTGISVLSGLGLQAYSKDQLDSIHYATLEVLQRTGIKVESAEAIEIFSNAGAIVERSKDFAIVKIPSYMVEDCLRWAPKTATFYGRVPKHDYAIEPNRVGFSTFGECIKVIDPFSREVRKSVKQDVGNVALVCDYLEEMDVMVRPLCSSDQNPATQPLHNLEVLLENTSKHIFIGAVSAANCRKMVEIAGISVGGAENFKQRPNMTIFVCPTSPLTLVKNCCDVIIQAARSGVGLAIIPMALAGATSTVTLAGTLVTHNAEVLSALILAQLTVRGTPCIYCSMSTIMDLKQLIGPVGSPEHGLLGISAVKMAQYYQLPSWMGGGISDSKIPDAQIGYEYTLNALLGALSGASIVYGAGALEQGLTIDFAKLLLDADMIRLIRQAINGVELSDETLALDVIHQVGPGGEFMTSEHTFQHMRQQSQPKLFNRKNRDIWSEAGAKDVSERAYEEARFILKNHKPEPLPKGARETIRTLISDYEQELGI